MRGVARRAVDPVPVAAMPVAAMPVTATPVTARRVEVPVHGLLFLAGETTEPRADGRRQPALEVVEEVPERCARGRNHQDSDDDERKPGHDREDDQRHSDEREERATGDEGRPRHAAAMPTGFVKQDTREEAGPMAFLWRCLGAGHGGKCGGGYRR